MVIKPRVRGFICITAHPEAAAAIAVAAMTKMANAIMISISV